MGAHMKRLALFLSVGIACLGSGGAANGQLPSQPYLYGVWEGVMTVVEQREPGNPMLPPFNAQQFPFRLDIRDTNLVMYFQGGDGWVGIGEGADLRLNEQGRSAIVLAAMSAGDPSETWMINVTRWNEQTLMVYLSQVVSRNGQTGDGPTTFGALGQMMKVSEGG